MSAPDRRRGQAAAGIQSFGAPLLDSRVRGNNARVHELAGYSGLTDPSGVGMEPTLALRATPPRRGGQTPWPWHVEALRSL
jgi:hypothetical protein